MYASLCLNGHPAIQAKYTYSTLLPAFLFGCVVYASATLSLFQSLMSMYVQRWFISYNLFWSPVNWVFKSCRVVNYRYWVEGVDYLVFSLRIFLNQRWLILNLSSNDFKVFLKMIYKIKINLVMMTFSFKSTAAVSIQYHYSTDFWIFLALSNMDRYAENDDVDDLLGVRRSTWTRSRSPRIWSVWTRWREHRLTTSQPLSSIWKVS